MFFPYTCIIDSLTTQKYANSMIPTNIFHLLCTENKRKVHFSIKNYLNSG